MIAPEMRRLVLLALLAGVVPVVLSAPLLAQRPSGPWMTVETEHSRIHYRKELGPWAQSLASRIESIHERVTAFVGYEPRKKLDVVVTDPIADANGVAWPFLDRPSMTLYATAPDSESVIGNDRDWIELLALHEDTHLVHLLRPRRRGSAVLEFLLPIGPLTLRCPRWAIEGYATLVEGALTGSGRPYGAFRAMVIRRRAIDGQLPPYGSLNGTEGWQAGSMAYLVGSAYLEWLEERQGPGSLVKLWKRIAGRDHPSFSRAFKGIFGEAPDVLYARFAAEVTAQALQTEKEWGKAALQDGEPWQRFLDETRSLTLSKDGTLLAAVRRHGKEGPRVDVWTVERTADEKKRNESAEARTKKRLADPEEVADLPEIPRPREPRWSLSIRNGYAPSSPRFLPDARILFVRKGPDGEGFLHPDLWVWTPANGDERRVTRLSDIREADPSPDGRWALGVRSRFGASGPVRVDLMTGEVTALAPLSVEEIWTAPRLSPDGKEALFTVHRGGRWRLLRSPLSEPLRLEEVDLGGASPVGAAAVSANGRLFLAVDRGGIWNVEERTTPGGAWSLRTRVLGGALSPAPATDGKSLFFLEMTSRGIDVRRLSLAAAPLASAPLPGQPPIAPRPAAAVAPPDERSAAAPRPYSPWDTMRLALAAGTTVGPAGFSQQAGVSGDDLLGRLRWQLLGGLADDSGEKGGSFAVACRKYPVEIRAQLFSVSQHVSNQRLVSPAFLDRSRSGVSADARWSRLFDSIKLGLRAGGVWASVRPDHAEPCSRALGAAGLDLELGASKGRWGVRARLSADGSTGRTDANAWAAVVGQGSLAVGTPIGTLTASGGMGATGSSPTQEDLFRVGSMATPLTPPLLDLNRIESPALPEAFETGRHVNSGRVDFRPAGLSWLSLYGAFFHAWDSPMSGGATGVVRLTGAELRFSSRDLPLDMGGDLTVLLGVAKMHGDVPGSGATTGYAAFVVRP
jgi:hypothetical protein